MYIYTHICICMRICATDLSAFECLLLVLDQEGILYWQGRSWCKCVRPSHLLSVAGMKWGYEESREGKEEGGQKGGREEGREGSREGGQKGGCD